jgi:hypothetical protein
VVVEVVMVAVAAVLVDTVNLLANQYHLEPHIPLL